MVISFCYEKGSSKYEQLKKPEDLSKVLIQMWVASSKTTEGGEEYIELTTQNKPFYIPSDDGGGLASYRQHSLAYTITKQEDDEEDDNKEEGVISRVFRNKRPEISPNISYYSLHEYPQRDFAFSCGIRASLCVPFYKTIHIYDFPDGVLEFVSTCDDQLKKFREYCRYYEAFFFRKIRMYLLGQPRLLFRQHIPEMDHLLTVLCQTLHLPLAQCWVDMDIEVGALDVMSQKSNIDYQNITPWCDFKDACYVMGVYIGEGLVGKSYLSYESFFCRDITELSITNYPFAHYASDCGSIACFTICLLSSFTLGYRECVLEFFLPSQGTDSNYPQTLLNSILETMKEHLPFYKVASGEELGQVLSVEVIKSSTHNEPEYLKIGQAQSSFPHHEGDASQQLPRSLHLLFEDGTVQAEHVEDIEKSNSTINTTEETATGETSTRAPDNVAEIIHVDALEEESPLKCIEPQSLNSQPERSEEILQDVGNIVEMDYSTLEMTLEERVDELVEEPPVEGVAYATSNEDVSYALSNEEDMNFERISKHFGRPLDDAAKSFGVSRSTFKRICRGLGIKRWQSGKRRMRGNISFKLGRGLNDEEPSRRNFSCSGMAPVHDTVVAHTSQDLIKMTVKATYKGVTIRFKLPDLSGIAELENNVIERLHLERKSFSIKYQDEEGDWVLIACDKDVREYMEISRSLKKTTIKILLDLPINLNAP